MKKIDLENSVDVVGAGIKGGAGTALAATAVGWTLVEKTVFFGLITTGTMVSPWLVAAWAAGGATTGMGTKALALGIKRKKVEKAMNAQINRSTRAA